jgi:hypothetical protein
MPPLCGGACVKPKRQAGPIYERTFWKWGGVVCGSPTATDLHNSASSLDVDDRSDHVASLFVSDGVGRLKFFE